MIYKELLRPSQNCLKENFQENKENRYTPATAKNKRGATFSRSTTISLKNLIGWLGRATNKFAPDHHDIP